MASQSLSTAPSNPLIQNNKNQHRLLQENEPTSSSSINTILTTTLLSLLIALSVLSLIHQNTTHRFHIFLLVPVLSVAALLWQKYKIRRVRRTILDEEETVALMDEDETLEDGGELYAVGWEDGSRDSKDGDGGDLGR